LVLSSRSAEFTTGELGSIGYLREVLFVTGSFIGAWGAVAVAHGAARPTPDSAA
jgi:hypothetical protein